jgi:hypothetical protein
VAVAVLLEADVDQFGLIGLADDLVGDRFALTEAGDPLDHVVDRLEMLDVEGGDHVDAGVEQLADVLPALLVPAAGHVGVRQVIDEDALGSPGKDRVEIHLLEAGPRSAIVLRGTTSRSPIAAPVSGAHRSPRTRRQRRGPAVSHAGPR